MTATQVRPPLEPGRQRDYLTPVALLRTLLLVFAAMIFAFGGLARASEGPASEPPCHEAPGKAPAGTPGKATLAMSCCVGCMPAPQALPGPGAAPVATLARAYPRPIHRLVGRLLAPEPPPPRG